MRPPDSAIAPFRLGWPNSLRRSTDRSLRSVRGTPPPSPRAIGVALDRCAEEFETLGALLSAADAAAQAATAHHRSEDRRRAAASAALANRLAAQCGGATTPAIRAISQPLPLTAREREITNLIAAGLSNREIAERLCISVRTVEGHIYRIGGKRDVADDE